MGLVLMGGRELQRIEVLAKVLNGSLRPAAAAHVPGLSQRQVRRLIRKGGARLNGVLLGTADEPRKLHAADFGAAGELQLSAGKKRHGVVELRPAGAPSSETE